MLKSFDKFSQDSILLVSAEARAVLSDAAREGRTAAVIEDVRDAYDILRPLAVVSAARLLIGARGRIDEGELRRLLGAPGTVVDHLSVVEIYGSTPYDNIFLSDFFDATTLDNTVRHALTVSIFCDLRACPVCVGGGCPSCAQIGDSIVQVRPGRPSCFGKSPQERFEEEIREWLSLPPSETRI